MTSITPDNRKGPSKSKSYSNDQCRGNIISTAIKVNLFCWTEGEFISPQLKPTTKSFPTKEEIHQELNNIKSLVNEFPPFVVSRLIPYFRAKVNSFKGGQLSSFCHIWERLTSDASILQIISGDCIEFLSDPPSQVSHPPNSVPRDHVSLVDKEIKSLLDKGVIVPCDHKPGEFISPIFTVPKKDGSVRLILNLKNLNMFIKNSHFKMDTIHTILKLVTPNCWMVSLDLKDA